MNTKQKIQLPAGVTLLGDPHLGKTFTKGVPLAYQGKRELLVNFTFEDSYATKCKLHICVGDLFDKFRVPEENILFAFYTIRDAALANPDTQYVILQGNHDASRDVTLTSSFELFSVLCQSLANVHIIKDFRPQQVFKVGNTKFLFFPWMPFSTAEEVAQEICAHTPIDKQTIVVGHWDIKDFSALDDSSPNMIPYSQFQDAKGIVTGHYHNAMEFLHEETNVMVKVTGSMQPYSHSEDPDELMYITLTKDELLKRLDAGGPNTFTEMNVRVLLEKGEEPMAELDCLSLSYKMALAGGEEDLNVQLDTFSLESVFSQTFAEFGVSPELTNQLWILSQESNDAE